MSSNINLIHYYAIIDRHIRAVLCRYGIQYNDQQDYYNDVFIAIWSKVEKQVDGFDEAKGRLEAFISTIVINAAISWVRQYHKRLCERPLTVSMKEDNWLSAVCELDEQRLHEIQRAMRQLSDSHRITLRLMGLAYVEMSESDIALIAQIKGASAEATLAEIQKEREILRNQRKYQEAEALEIELEAIYRSMLYLDREIERRTASLTEMGCDNVEGIQADAAQKTIRDLMSAQKTLEKQRCLKAISETEFARESTSLRLKAAAIRLARLQKKRERLLEQYRKGRDSVMLPPRQIASILGISQNAARMRIFHMRQALRQALGK